MEALYSVSHTDTEALKIGSFEVFTTYFLHQLKSWLPEIELKLYELTPGKMEESVGKGLIDFGITYVPIPYEGVEFVEVGKLKMGVYKKTESFINQELGELPFVVPNFPLEGSPSGVKGLDSWPESAPDRKIKYRVDLMESALALCREGHCAVFIPDFVAKIHNQISHSDYQLDQWNPPKNIADKIKNVVRTIYIVKRKSMEETAEIRKIARWIRSLN